jgi:uncharacterized protein
MVQAIDPARLDEISGDECHRLLARAHVGRVAIHRAALPAIFPVNFVLTPEGIVFRTRHGSTLASATNGTVVAFEVDDVDPMAHGGWSVMVVGVATAINEEPELTAARALPLRSWAADGEADRYVRIALDLVSGRRIHRPGSPSGA